MCSGKSEHGQKQYMNDPYNSIVLKPWTADRDGPFLVSRATDIKIAARMVDPSTILGAIAYAKAHGYKNIIIDEAHDFPGPRYLSPYKNLNIFIYGLNRWADGTRTWLSRGISPFEYQKRPLFAVCDKCGSKKAEYTAHISGTNRITAIYKPLCSKCMFTHLTNKQTEIDLKPIKT